MSSRKSPTTMRPRGPLDHFTDGMSKGALADALVLVLQSHWGRAATDDAEVKMVERMRITLDPLAKSRGDRLPHLYEINTPDGLRGWTTSPRTGIPGATTRRVT